MPTNHSLVSIVVEDVPLEADLMVPDGAGGLVIFVHKGGGNRHCPEDRAVAEALHRAGLATLMVDLLCPSEADIDRACGLLRTNVPLHSRRVVGAVDWARSRAPFGKLPLGLFGVGSGQVPALIAASQRPAFVRALVSRGGHSESLPAVQAATLMLSDQSLTVEHVASQARDWFLAKLPAEPQP